jgi:hypothetical protein
VSALTQTLAVASAYLGWSIALRAHASGSPREIACAIALLVIAAGFVAIGLFARENRRSSR